jgi:copper chaperone
MCTDCSCNTVNIETPTAQDETSASTYQVSGMTCGHCASSVSEQIRRIEGVATVNVDVASGRVTVHHTKPVDDNAIRTAVDEAGYTLVTA